MTDSRNISDILENWDYDSQSIRARLVSGQNGNTDVLQMRIEMGIIQMGLKVVLTVIAPKALRLIWTICCRKKLPMATTGL